MGGLLQFVDKLPGLKNELSRWSRALETGSTDKRGVKQKIVTDLRRVLTEVGPCVHISEMQHTS